MPTFLNTIAQDILTKYGSDLSRITIVFPNKRASLFLDAELSTLCDRPIWSPQYTTISDLFRSRSQWEIADRIQLICELHKSYRAITGTKETLDQFYAWGELLLTDFDDIDKHLANPEKVFMILGDLHAMDSVDFLTKEQEEVLMRFFSFFSKEHNSELRQRFLNMWNKLGDIYADYHRRLKEKGIAYEGMLYRSVIEDGLLEEAPETYEVNAEVTNYNTANDLQRYIFVGFNLLNTVEERLFMHYMKHHGARFYWDFDEYYMKQKTEAGRYVQQYLRIFPNELPIDHDIYRQFTEKEDMTFCSSPTEDLQARYVAEWLTPERIAAGRRTAIVLADEGLLDTVLHCLPPAVKHVNITTGFPLEKSAAASFVRLLMALLQRRSLTLHLVNNILTHPYARLISPKAQELYASLNEEHTYYPTLAELALDDDLALLFAPLEDSHHWKQLNTRLMALVRLVASRSDKNDHFNNEALFRIYTILNRLGEQLQHAEDFNNDSDILYTRLLQQVIQLTTIPFHGEPIEGIQVMGILETRNLDFDHMLVLSCNEGNIPAKINDSSFIPYTVRKEYGLTTVDNKVAIYAYYFHRMMQRATDVQILYNKSTADGHTGEMSRFMLQLMAESDMQIRMRALTANQDTISVRQDAIAKGEALATKLIERGYLSPSALGKYLRCPLQFFYRYVAGISDTEESDTEEMDNMSFGNIFHRAAELLYKPFINREVTAEYLDSLLKEKGYVTIKRYIDQAFREVLFLITDEKRPTPRLGGLQVINREMLITFMINLIRYDRQRAPFRILGLESDAYAKLEVNTFLGPKTLRIGGKIDRLQLTINNETAEQNINVIDYKTGRLEGSLSMKSMEEIFIPEEIGKHSDYFLQALMYSIIISRKYAVPTSPALYFIQKVDKEDFEPKLKIEKEIVDDVRLYTDEYRENLTKLIEEILNPNISFCATTKETRCDKCVYRMFCR